MMFSKIKKIRYKTDCWFFLLVLDKINLNIIFFFITKYTNLEISFIQIFMKKKFVQTSSKSIKRINNYILNNNKEIINNYK
jgi:hypothetical protein